MDYVNVGTSGHIDHGRSMMGQKIAILGMTGAALAMHSMSEILSSACTYNHMISQLWTPSFPIHPDFGRKDYIEHHKHPKNTIYCSSRRGRSRKCKKSSKLKSRRKKK